MDQTKPERQTKNMAIESAINRLDRAVDDLEDFVRRVQEGDTPPSKELDKLSGPISLMSTLNTATEKLDIITDRVLKAIAELKSALF